MENLRFRFNSPFLLLLGLSLVMDSVFASSVGNLAGFDGSVAFQFELFAGFCERLAGRSGVNQKAPGNYAGKCDEQQKCRSHGQQTTMTPASLLMT